MLKCTTQFLPVCRDWLSCPSDPSGGQPSGRPCISHTDPVWRSGLSHDCHHCGETHVQQCQLQPAENYSGENGAALWLLGDSLVNCWVKHTLGNTTVQRQHIMGSTYVHNNEVHTKVVEWDLTCQQRNHTNVKQVLEFPLLVYMLTT